MLIMISYPYQGCDNIASHDWQGLTFGYQNHSTCIVWSWEPPNIRNGLHPRKLSESPPTERLKSCNVDDPVPDSDFCLILFLKDSWDPSKTFPDHHAPCISAQLFIDASISWAPVVLKSFAKASTPRCDVILGLEAWYMIYINVS